MGVKVLYAAMDEKRRGDGLTWAGLAAILGYRSNQVTGLRMAKCATGMDLAMRLVQWLVSLDRPPTSSTRHLMIRSGGDDWPSRPGNARGCSNCGPLSQRGSTQRLADHVGERQIGHQPRRTSPRGRAQHHRAHPGATELGDQGAQHLAVRGQPAVDDHHVDPA